MGKQLNQEAPKNSTSTSKNTAPTNGPTDDWYWSQLKRLGIGTRYHHADPEKIRIVKEIETYLVSSEWRDGRGLFLVGSVGTGKTSILAYIAYRLARYAGYNRSPSEPENSEYWQSAVFDKLKFITATGLFNMFFGWRDNDIADMIKKLVESPILMIDDLGREYRSDFPTSRFEEFIEHRYANELTTIVTSNIAPGALMEMKEFERIVDRFKDSKWMRLLTVTGKSQRK